MGRPVAIFSGANLVQRVNNMEFGDVVDSRSDRARKRLEQGKKEKPKIFGSNNLMFERNKDQHSFLRLSLIHI